MVVVRFLVIEGGCSESGVMTDTGGFRQTETNPVVIQGIAIHVTDVRDNRRMSYCHGEHEAF